MTDAITIITEPGSKWFVWCKKGRTPRFAHDTMDSAMTEAVRLSTLTPGAKFHVMQSVAKVSARPAQQPAPATVPEDVQ